MKKKKKILSLLIKVLVGIASFGIVYLRLGSDLTAERMAMITASLSTVKSMAFVTLALLLIPVNWGLEALKWQNITAPVERVSYGTATRSVYSGLCLGNLAPGRATEFLAKIIYFDIDNRPQVTVLHFVNGMFQLAVTVVAGFAAMAGYIRNLHDAPAWMISAATVSGTILLAGLVLAIGRIDTLINAISRKISRDRNEPRFHYEFTFNRIMRLMGYSAARYLVFYCQFALILSVFHQGSFSPGILPGIALYFLITTTIPMISVLEAATRAAVALVVFRDAGIGSAALSLTAVLVWLANIILPSIAGYYFLLRQNFNFKLFRSKS